MTVPSTPRRSRLCAHLFVIAPLLACDAAPPSTTAVAGARTPAGAYSAGVAAGNLLFVAGHVGTDPTSGALVPGGAPAEATRAMENIRVVLGNAGLDFGDVVKTTIFLADIADFAAVNEAYAAFFTAGAVLPARSTVQVAALPIGARVEIEMIATRRR